MKSYNQKESLRGVCKKSVLKISQNLQENTCVRVSFLIKLQAEACNFIEKETLAQVFSCEFWEIFKNTFFIEHLSWLLLNNVRWGNCPNSYWSVWRFFSFSSPNFVAAWQIHGYCSIVHETTHFMPLVSFYTP